MFNYLSSLLFLLISILSVSCSKKHTPGKTFNYNENTFVQNGYTLNWQNNDPAFDINLKKQLIETFFVVYPKLVKDFNPNSAKTVLFRVDTAYKGVAAASGADIVYNPKWFEKNPKDIDVVTHEVMHTIQSYPSYDPWWMVEGIADYVRYKYGVANAEGGWSLPAVNNSQKYDNGYRVTARFLAWCENKKPGSVKTFDAALRNKSYSPKLWNTLFGKTVDELWADYIVNPTI